LSQPEETYKFVAVFTYAGNMCLGLLDAI